MNPIPARFRFYAELNDFLPAQLRYTEFDHQLTRRASVKDVIESLGVPHTEVELILVNGESRDFSCIVGDGDQISVYPMFESFDIRPVLRLRAKPLRKSCFVADTNVGRLARYLRLLGFDCAWQNDWDDARIAQISLDEHRIVLTRDRKLLQRKIITHGYYVRAVIPRQQVHEVVKRFDLYRDMTVFSRCSVCNGLLQDVSKQQVIDQLEPKTRRYYNNFRRCDSCGQIYWQGSHIDRVQVLVNEIVAAGAH